MRPRAVPPPAPILRDPHAGPLRSLLHAAYDLVWLAAALLATPWWLTRVLLDPPFRRMARERLTIALARGGPAPPGGRVLVHGVSVGEVKGAAPLVRALERLDPAVEVVVSTSTATGLEVARALYAGHRVVRFPLDPSPLVRRFLARLAPSAVVLVELEIWPNFLRECNRSGVPVAVVNGRITPASFARYRLFRRALPQFDRVSLFCVQLEAYARRFRELCGEPARVLVTGNMKADGLRIGASQPRPELARLLGGGAQMQVIVAGSTHGPEEREVALAWREGAPGSRLILVPRHPPRAEEVLRDLAALGLRGQLLTRLRAGLEEPDPGSPAVVDTIGELEGVYALADLVFVGGSLVPHGGQNMLEPAAQGCPVLYGPHLDNFRAEAALLEAAGASRRVAGAAELAEAFRELTSDGEARGRMGEAGLRAVVAQQGATELTLRALRERCLGAGRGAGAERAGAGGAARS